MTKQNKITSEYKTINVKVKALDLQLNKYAKEGYGIAHIQFLEDTVRVLLKRDTIIREEYSSATYEMVNGTMVEKDITTKPVKEIL